MKWLVLPMARILQAFPIITTTRSFFKSASISRPSCEWAVTLDPQQHAAWIEAPCSPAGVYWQLTDPNFAIGFPRIPMIESLSQGWRAGFIWMGLHSFVWKRFPSGRKIPSYISYWPKSWLSLRPQDGISKRYRTWHVALLECCLSKPGKRNPGEIGMKFYSDFGGRPKLGYQKQNILHTNLVSFWTVWSM